MTYPTVCLVMIFKNEEAVLTECLRSCADFINFAVLLDSDSTDGSRDIISKELKRIPHEIHNWDQQPFRADAKRTRALKLAKGKADYLLMLDADNVLEITDEDSFMNQLQDLTADACMINKKLDHVTYPFISMLRGNMDWKFEGVIHEYPTTADGSAFTQGTLDHCVIHEMTKGEGGRGRNLAAHYFDHALILEREIFEQNGKIRQHLLNRYMFYLGNSYKDAGMKDRAIDAYQARIALGGWEEEIFYCLYMIAKLKNEILPALEAWNYRPHRLEAAYFAMQLLMARGWVQPALAIGYAAELEDNERGGSRDVLFVELDIYDTYFPEMLQDLQKKISLVV